MRITILTLALLPFFAILQAQTAADTTIYDVADSAPYPLIGVCSAERNPGWNVDSIRRCSEMKLFSLLSSNIRYPAEAREKNVQGTTVVSFIVETTGQMSNYKLLKDIGSGCGDEAMRVLKALDQIGLRWKPAQIQGKPVRMRQSLPLRFRLTEALPYYISDTGDSVYTNVETNPEFRGGMDSLLKFVVNRLDYPSEYRDSCKTGIIEMNVLLRGDRTLSVLNSLDFSGLGLDFQWEATRMIKKTIGQWIPARYQDKPVSTVFPLRALFKSDKATCKTANDVFERALLLSEEAAALVEQQKSEEAIKKWNEAIALQPYNTELIYYRGTALMNLNRREEACVDYNKIYQLLGITWFESIRKIMCP
jgi:TonB family protein